MDKSQTGHAVQKCSNVVIYWPIGVNIANCTLCFTHIIWLDLHLGGVLPTCRCQIAVHLVRTIKFLPARTRWACACIGGGGVWRRGGAQRRARPQLELGLALWLVFGFARVTMCGFKYSFGELKVINKPNIIIGQTIGSWCGRRWTVVFIRCVALTLTVWIQLTQQTLCTTLWVFSVLRYLARRFWNHTWTRASVKSIRVAKNSWMRCWIKCQDSPRSSLV